MKDNDIKFDSIAVDKTYHLIENKETPKNNLKISFLYPIDYTNKEMVNKTQKLFVSSVFGENYKELSPEEAIRKYSENYEKEYQQEKEIYEQSIADSKEEPRSSWEEFYQYMGNKLFFNKNELISYTVYSEDYAGGAHGSHSFLNYVINLKNGSFVTENDLFIDDSQDAIAKLLVNQLLKQNDLKDPKELENNGYFNSEEIIPNGNILINEEGITYTFNEYEIAAYSVGRINVLLPYDEIAHLLKEDSPVKTLIGNK